MQSHWQMGLGLLLKINFKFKTNLGFILTEEVTNFKFQYCFHFPHLWFSHSCVTESYAYLALNFLDHLLLSRTLPTTDVCSTWKQFSGFRENLCDDTCESVSHCSPVISSSNLL